METQDGKLERFVAALESGVSVAALVCMFLCIALQVFCRYVLLHALEWPEEVARYAFICAVFIGAGVAAREGRHLEISVCRYSFGPRVQRALTWISAILTLLFCAIMVWWGIIMVMFVAASDQVAASMPVPMYPFYILVPLGFLCMFFGTIRQTARSLRRQREAGDNARRDAIADMSNSW